MGIMPDSRRITQFLCPNLSETLARKSEISCRRTKSFRAVTVHAGSVGKILRGSAGLQLTYDFEIKPHRPEVCATD